MNNIPVTNGITMPIVVHTAMSVVQNAVAPVTVKRSFNAIGVRHFTSNTRRLRAGRRFVLARCRRREPGRRVRTPRQPRTRRAATRPTPTRNADSPPGPPDPRVGGAS
jgi:hypothetical protein